MAVPSPAVSSPVVSAGACSAQPETEAGGARVVVVWCPDWPVVAAGAAERVPVHHPVAVLAANRVVACSASARAHGVRQGQRRREAQGRCPELTVLADDPDRDARSFEPVVAAVEALVPGVEVLRPGLLAVPARGPARYFGSEDAVAERIVDAIAAQTGVECQIGIADGVFTAVLAAHRGLLVPPNGSAGFLAPLGIRELHQPADGADRGALVDLLHRLGLRSLGAFAALPVDSVASRFGPEGVRAYRLASGLDERPLSRRRPPVDLAVRRRLDPPVDRVDAAAFASREPAEELHAALSARGLACIRLGVSARTEAGEELYRVWRCAEPLTASGIADRVRWQLDGWLSSRGPRPSAGITVLHLVPEEVVGGRALQRGLWGESGEEDERAARALVRVQGMLGPEAVLTGVLEGGRNPADQVRLVPWGDDTTPVRPTAPAAGLSGAAAPGAGSPGAGSPGAGPAGSGAAGSGVPGSGPSWPGRLPAPSPTRVPARPLPAEVLDDTGAVVGVSGRGALTGTPYRVTVDGRPPRRVLSWAGPWPVDERWWAPEEARRCTRMQAVLDAEPSHRGDAPGERAGGVDRGGAGERGGTEECGPDGRGEGRASIAVLLTHVEDHWQVEGIYE